MTSRQPRSMRRLSNSHYASSASTSPERRPDEDNDSIMLHTNDSQSSLADSTVDDQEAQDRELEEICRVSPISRLPAELMIQIFQKLPRSSDLLHCMLVSRSWARNSVALLWHRPTTTMWQPLQKVVQTLRNPETAFDYHRLVKRLNLAQLDSQVSDGVLLPFDNCKRIERLTLTKCAKLTDMSVCKVIDGNSSLMALDITNVVHATDKVMETVAKNCFRLQGLNITNCWNITSEGLENIARNCRHIRRLKCNGCSQLVDTAIVAFAKNCRQLLEIDLENCHRLEDPAVTALISEGPSLRELRLANCIRITDEAFLNLQPGTTFEGLRILDLTSCIEIQDVGVQKIVEIAPRLRNLVLNKCRRITDRAISAITKLGKNLHFIHLGHCSQITDVGLQQLIRHCNRIRYIDLGCCTNLTDLSVTQLANLPRLKRVGLVKCGNITDLSILALASPRSSGHAPSSPTSIPSSLERVHLSYCTNLTRNGISALLNNCPRIAHLSLTGIQAFLQDELLCFCRDAPMNFTEHQRDMFCVFSGAGVGRLRNFLNDQAQAARLSSSGFPSTDGEGNDDVDMPDATPEPHLAPPSTNAILAPTAMPPNLQSRSTGPASPITPPPRTTAPPITLAPPPRPLSLPNLSVPTGPIMHPSDLPPLQIPSSSRLDPQSPTHDQPLSVDEGQEFIKFPETETDTNMEDDAGEGSSDPTPVQQSRTET